MLAYADNVCIFAQTREDIQRKLDKINLFFQWAGMSLNPQKCGSLSMINNSKRAYMELFSPALDPVLCIPALKWEDSYKYLGVNFGRERKGVVDRLEKILAAAGKIFDSPLSD